MAEEPSPSTVEGLSPCGGGPEVGPAVSDYNNFKLKTLNFVNITICTHIL